MKLTKLFSALTLIAAITFVACEDPYPNLGGPTRNPNIGDSGIDSSLLVTPPTDLDIPAGTLTVSQARDTCKQLADGATTGKKFYVKGWVKKLHSNHNQATIDQYGNGQFYMSQNKFTDGTYDDKDFMAFQVYYLNGEKFTAVNQIKEGDYLVIYGELTNFGGTYETVGKGAAHIYSIGGQIVLPDTCTVANLLELRDAEQLPEEGKGKDQRVVKGYIVGAYDETTQTYALGATNITTNLLIADSPDETDITKLASVKLDEGSFLQKMLNLADNADNLKEELLVYGTIESFCGIGGVVNIAQDNAFLNGVKVEKKESSEIISIAEFLTKPAGNIYTIKGQVTNITNATRGAFTLKDATGEVKVNMLRNENGDRFNTLGIEEGNTITIKGENSDGVIKSATLVSKE